MKLEKKASTSAETAVAKYHYKSAQKVNLQKKKFLAFHKAVQIYQINLVYNARHFYYRKEIHKLSLLAHILRETVISKMCLGSTITLLLHYQTTVANKKQNQRWVAVRKNQARKVNDNVL